MIELFRAVKAGNLGDVQAIVAVYSASVHLRDKDESTPLHWAAWKGHATIVEFLLESGADVGARNRNRHWGDTALHAAAHGNQREAAEALLRYGADPLAKDADGHTPLDETSFHNASSVAKLLRADRSLSEDRAPEGAAKAF